MPAPTPRRILALWFPYLAAERAARAWRMMPDLPLAIIGQDRGGQRLISLTAAAKARGLGIGQSLAQAWAICPDLITRPHSPHEDRVFLASLRRWMGKFTPWVAEEAPDSLVADISGCAHLFGGERALLDLIRSDCAELGLSFRAAIADTRGAAWALARYGQDMAGTSGLPVIIDEARATRVRSLRPKARPPSPPQITACGTILVPAGGARMALAALPIAALRLSQDEVTGLADLGLRQIGDLYTMARAGLARRFGRMVLMRLDQALGHLPEPISPRPETPHFAMRMTFPDPIAQSADVDAALARLIPTLCAKLSAAGRGARMLRLELWQAEGGVQAFDLRLARAHAEPDPMQELLRLRLDGIAAGFGFDRIRLVAVQTEPVHERSHQGGAQAAERRAKATAFDDLLTRLGSRLRMEALTRFAPVASHIPEKTQTRLMAAYAPAFAEEWPDFGRIRPLTLFRPEALNLPATRDLPAEFRWRGRHFTTLRAIGPERIAPEWWLDDPNWRSGLRDYWQIITKEGPMLWLFFAHGGQVSGGWFVQGEFC